MIQVGPVNDPPVATDIAATTPAGTARQLRAGGDGPRRRRGRRSRRDAADQRHPRSGRRQPRHLHAERRLQRRRLVHVPGQRRHGELERGDRDDHGRRPAARRPAGGGGGGARRPRRRLRTGRRWRSTAARSPKVGTPVQINLQATDPDGDPAEVGDGDRAAAASRGTVSAAAGQQQRGHVHARSRVLGVGDVHLEGQRRPLDSNVATTTVIVEAVLAGGTQARRLPHGGRRRRRLRLRRAGVPRAPQGARCGGARAAAVLAPSLTVLNSPIVDIAHQPNDQGYWLVGGRRRRLRLRRRRVPRVDRRRSG